MPRTSACVSQRRGVLVSTAWGTMTMYELRVKIICATFHGLNLSTLPLSSLPRKEAV